MARACPEGATVTHRQPAERIGGEGRPGGLRVPPQGGP